MSTTKEVKKERVKELAERLSKSKSFILTDFQGLSVAELSELRQAMKESGAEYKVCKNTLFKIALGDAPFKEQLENSLKGCTGVVFGYDDPVVAVKKAIEYSEKNEKFKLKHGVVEGKVYSPKELKEISKLPSKNVLLGMLLGGMSSPLSKMACVLQAVNLKLLYALEALKNKKAQ
ncbi:MAG: 50S ribosomal protein L10 [Thermodesulfovibrio sp.]|nr:50S ribosomal protein L10 [Thermodesulfovibrio sp.]